jgi:hypothetical protein
LRRAVAEMMMLEWNLMKINTEMRSGLMWLRMIDWWVIVNMVMNFPFPLEAMDSC